MAAAEIEYRCFVGGLAWATTDQALQEAFSAYGEILESKVRLLSQRSDLTRPDSALSIHNLWSVCVTILLCVTVLLCYSNLKSVRSSSSFGRRSIDLFYFLILINVLFVFLSFSPFESHRCTSDGSGSLCIDHQRSWDWSVTWIWICDFQQWEVDEGCYWGNERPESWWS